MAKQNTKVKKTPKKKTQEPKKKIQKAPKLKAANPFPRTYYTLREDATIISAMKDNKVDNKSLQELTKNLGRSYESVRDRVRRYLSQLSKDDQKLILKNAKKEPGNYVAFVQGKEGLKVQQISLL